jgi:hypothetical protein
MSEPRIKTVNWEEIEVAWSVLTYLAFQEAFPLLPSSKL